MEFLILIFLMTVPRRISPAARQQSLRRHGLQPGLPVSQHESFVPWLRWQLAVRSGLQSVYAPQCAAGLQSLRRAFLRRFRRAAVIRPTVLCPAVLRSAGYRTSAGAHRSATEPTWHRPAGQGSTGILQCERGRERGREQIATGWHLRQKSGIRQRQRRRR